jgi:hypothetical protein
MRDCKREEAWESANRRKAMNGFSGSMVGQEGLEADKGFSGSEGRSDEDAIVYSTTQIDRLLGSVMSCGNFGSFDRKALEALHDALTTNAKPR